MQFDDKKTIEKFCVSEDINTHNDLINAIGGYYVGGCVRDHILGRKSNDIDAATHLNPEEITRIARRLGYIVIPTGINHGTVTCILTKDKSKFEIQVTTFRKDNFCDGRHSSVDFVSSMQEDAKRRDFTINALYMDSSGKIYDPNFQGLSDIKNNIVRFIGNPEERILEDHLRIMRFFRFSLKFADNIDEEGVIASNKNILLVKKLSRERVREEYKKILEHDSPYKILNIIRKNLEIIGNDTISEDCLENIVLQEQNNDIKFPWIVKLFAHSTHHANSNPKKEWVFSKAESRAWKDLLDFNSNPNKSWKEFYVDKDKERMFLYPYWDAFRSNSSNNIINIQNLINSVPEIKIDVESFDCNITGKDIGLEIKRIMLEKLKYLNISK
jgi:tRNA nucleotidyltransferase/poly(A) polymerase